MARLKQKRMKELNEKEDRFVDLFIGTGDMFYAYSNSGYSCEGRGWRANARKKHTALRDHIEQRMHQRISHAVPWSFNEMMKLAKVTKNETLKFKILQDIMGRAGYDQPKIIEHRADAPEDMESKDIAEEIRDLIEKTGAVPLKAVGDDK